MKVDTLVLRLMLSHVHSQRESAQTASLSFLGPKSINLLILLSLGHHMVRVHLYLPFYSFDFLFIFLLYYFAFCFNSTQHYPNPVLQRSPVKSSIMDMHGMTMATATSTASAATASSTAMDMSGMDMGGMGMGGSCKISVRLISISDSLPH